MNEVLGDVLPLALGVAISPIPIIAAILMLLSPKARATSLGFLAGWLVGIVAATAVFVALASVLPDQDSDSSAPIAGTVKVVLGALMLLLAAKQWRGRPAPGDQAPLPGWMTAIDSMNAVKGAGLGFLLSAINPKNLLMAAGAGVVVGSAGLDDGQIVVAVAVFTLIAGCSVAIPVLGYLVASRAMAGPLDGLRAWLVQHNAAVMAVLLLVIGVTMIGKGIGSL